MRTLHMLASSGRSVVLLGVIKVNGLLHHKRLTNLEDGACSAAADIVDGVDEETNEGLKVQRIFF